MFRLTASKIPWFCGPEFDALRGAVDAAAVVAAAIILDKVVTVAAAEAPKSKAELALALFKESRALQASIEQLIA